MPRTTDFILLRCTLEDASGLAPAAARSCAQSPWPMTLYRAAWSEETHHAVIYGRLAQRSSLTPADLEPLAALWHALCPTASETRLDRLEQVFDSPGHSSSNTPVFHYVVEMDPDDGWMPEIARWYDTEHMPGLAAVPGCIHTKRMLNHDHGPLSLACYDLVTQETLGSPPWLAVRGTAWSDITRPHFTNTRRTMMKVMA